MVAALLALIAAQLACEAPAAGSLHIPPPTAESQSNDAEPFAIDETEPASPPDMGWLVPEGEIADVPDQAVGVPVFSRALTLDGSSEPGPAIEMMQLTMAASPAADASPVAIPYASAGWAGVVGMLLIFPVLASRRLMRRILA